MVKKAGLVVLLILVAAAFYFLRNKENLPLSTEKQSVAITAVTNAPEIDPLPKSLEITSGEKKKTSKPGPEAEDDKNFEEFDRLEEKWLNQMQTFFNDEKKFNIYMMFRDSSEKEKLDAYEEYHKHLEAKYGKNYSYSLSEDDTKREESINNKYLNKIKLLLGEKEYIKYLEVKDQFNKEEAKKMTNKKSLLIEI